MHALDLDGDVIRYGGVQDLARSSGGVGFRRLPAWTRPQIADPTFQFLLTMPSGARLEFDTDSTTVELEVGLTLLRMGDAPIIPAAFDVAFDSLAFAGQCQLDPFVARTIRDLPADLISLKVGINLVNADSMRERAFVPAVHGFLDTIRDGHPATPVVLITPILCPAHEQASGPTVPGPTISTIDRPTNLALGALTIGRIRELLAEVVATRQAGGDNQLHLLDGRELFGEDDLADLPDGLHPNAAGYVRMGERFHQMAFGADGPFT